MNFIEYNELTDTGKLKSPQSTLEGKWFTESYEDVVTWEKTKYGGDFCVVFDKGKINPK